MESDKAQRQKKKHPFASANPISKIFALWTWPIFFEGWKRELTQNDLPEPLRAHASAHLGDKLEKAWNAQIEKKCEGTKKTPSLFKAFVSVFGIRLTLLSSVYLIVDLGCKVAQPLFLGHLIQYFTPGSKISREDAFLYATGVLSCSAVTVILFDPAFLGLMHLGMKCRVSVCSLVYRKALRLSKTSLGQTTVGQIVNLMSNDVNRFDQVFLLINNVWVAPAMTIILTYIMWTLVGWSSLVGLGFLILFIPLQVYLGNKASDFRMKTALRTDERVRLMNEIISGIQVIKMYSWEVPFAKIADLARRKEISQIKNTAYIKAILSAFYVFHSRTSLFGTLLAYVLLGNYITADKVFILTSFYNTLRHNVSLCLPQAITQMAETMVSIKRIQKFLMYEETENESVTDSIGLKKEETSGYENGQTKSSVLSNYFHNKERTDTPSISLKNVTVKWSPNLIEPTLSKVNLEIIANQLTVIIGPVGSGKSSLFHALLKELPVAKGTVKISGTMSYASQEPWLFQGSVRQNILFGEEYDKARYNKVVMMCALSTDFKQFPYGDKTICSERGVSLSGGQRARINLARAVYKDADIYLLDDPLSAVDTHVGKHLFEDCIQRYLKNKTVVLITHQVQYLESVDQIVLLESGQVKGAGTYRELQQSNSDFVKLLTIEKNEDGGVEPIENMTDDFPPMRLPSRTGSVLSTVSSMLDEPLSVMPEEVAESKSSDAVSSAVVKAYFAGTGQGCCFTILVMLLFVLSQTLASGSDYWLTYWVNLEEYVYSIPANSTQEVSYSFVANRNQCISVFIGLTIATIIAAVTRSFLFYTMCMNSSIRLHDSMFTSISRATMWFFNNNSSGRVLNRFSKDIGSIDEFLPTSMMDVLQLGSAMLSVVVICAIINVWIVIPTVFCVIIFYSLRNVYMATSRSVKRLEGITRSPVFSHLSATLQGMTTIRAFSAQKILAKEFDYHQDLHSSAWFYFISCSTAFGIWLDTVCLAYMTFIAMSFLWFDTGSFGGDVGLSITQSIGLTGTLQWGMRQMAELENHMTSVERVYEYTQLESEPPLESKPGKAPPKSWPTDGRIVFEQMFLRYNDNDPAVLKDLNFAIQPEEKVGVVGRTGAGKSSLIQALFRLAKIEGKIFIDNVETSTIGLHDLRSNISIIPQEPVLFSGTMRKNLDPFDQQSDERLWSALEEVELKEVVKEMPRGLQAQITEGGSNLSVGQRQLVCLARAIVRNNKILILDEATANVDPQTDALIQSTIRRKFNNCTVITIAHRLHTIMDSDKILVMDAGKMAEFDHPHTLLQKPSGIFIEMVEQTGKSTEEFLRKTAADAYDSRNSS